MEADCSNAVCWRLFLPRIAALRPQMLPTGRCRLPGHHTPLCCDGTALPLRENEDDRHCRRRDATRCLCITDHGEQIKIRIAVNAYGYQCAVLRCEDTFLRLCPDAEHELIFMLALPSASGLKLGLLCFRQVRHSTILIRWRGCRYDLSIMSRTKN